MSVIVRPIEKEDWEEWLRLFNLYLVFYKASLDIEVKKVTFERFFDVSVPVWAALAIDTETNKPIGLVNYLEHYGTWSIAKKIYLNDLYVDETSRLHGVGRKLIEYVYEKADELGSPEVYWATDFHNHRAQLLYTKVGVLKGKTLYQRDLTKK